MENDNNKVEEEELITDFTGMFKKGGPIKKKPVLGGNSQKAINKTPNWLLEIPAKL